MRSCGDPDAADDDARFLRQLTAPDFKEPAIPLAGRVDDALYGFFRERLAPASAAGGTEPAVACFQSSASQI